MLRVPAEKVVKTLMVVTGDQQGYLLLLRGDHMLNEVKASKQFTSNDGFRFASELVAFISGGRAQRIPKALRIAMGGER